MNMSQHVVHQCQHDCSLEHLKASCFLMTDSRIKTLFLPSPEPPPHPVTLLYISLPGMHDLPHHPLARCSVVCPAKPYLMIWFIFDAIHATLLALSQQPCTQYLVCTEPLSFLLRMAVPDALTQAICRWVSLINWPSRYLASAAKPVTCVAVISLTTPSG